MLDFDFLCASRSEALKEEPLDLRFDRTIFNFPHSGFLGKDTDSGFTEKHIHLVFGFINGASHMVRGDGGIHVSHKDCYKPSVTRKIKFLQCI
ncbi:BnaC06g26310D [Brassica napus]|uniref:BnaC06g26310D protein n=1 Tax=Brassica napus TaxID=3708 RepID=A0A078GW22_BRANA|nr:BnaC06g26310D [Brassica napus]